MPNLRIIHDNVADDADTLVADSTAGALAAAYMLTDIKGQVHRSVGNNVEFTLTWPDGVTIGALGLPATNLTATATQQLLLFSDTACTAQIADSGVGYACPGLNVELWDWNRPINGNSFAYGGASKSAIWLPAHYFAKGAKIILDDPDNTVANGKAGYIDCARIVLGPYWEPVHTAELGAAVTIVDTTVNTRNDAGDLLPDQGIKHDGITFDLKLMPEADRAELMRIRRRNGVSRGIFWSLVPGAANPLEEQDGMGYGKPQNDSVSYQVPRHFASKFTIEGW